MNAKKSRTETNHPEAPHNNGKHHSPITAYVALGSNVGKLEENLQTALNKLRHIEGVEVRRVSKFLKNPAVGGPEDSPPFLNAVAELSTTLAAHALLHALMDVEREMGRIRRVKWEPRVIDLDLLLYGDHILSSQELVVPHPLMHERRFVLEPLAELAPDFVHPTLNMTIAGMLENR